jgi:hypothetical protein
MRHRRLASQHGSEQCDSGFQFRAVVRLHCGTAHCIAAPLDPIAFYKEATSRGKAVCAMGVYFAES